MLYWWGKKHLSALKQPWTLALKSTVQVPNKVSRHAAMVTNCFEMKADINEVLMEQGFCWKRLDVES